MAEYNRILIVDDTPSIHDDFRKILNPSEIMGRDLEDMADSLFGESTQDAKYKDIKYRLESAFQGEEALQKIEKAELDNDGYSLVFMDVRMPPGLDGIKTIARIWEKYPSMEIVICTAYSDYSWVDIIEYLGPSDHLLVLKKPFDADEAQQMALAMTKRASRLEEHKTHIKSLTCNLQECNSNVELLKKKLDKND